MSQPQSYGAFRQDLESGIPCRGKLCPCRVRHTAKRKYTNTLHVCLLSFLIKWVGVNIKHNPLYGPCLVKKCLRTCAKYTDISSCASAKYHSDLCCLFVHKAVSLDFASGQWRPWSDYAVLMSTHNLFFWAEIRKKCIPYKPQFYYIKVGFNGVRII